MGFEGISDEELLRFNKRLRVSTNDQAIKVLEELGVDLWASFIVEPSFNLEEFKNLRTYVRSRSIKNFYLKAHDLNALRSLSFPSPDRAS